VSDAVTHCLHPTFEEGVVPIYLDLETGRVMRLRAGTRVEDLRWFERCCRCGWKKLRSLEARAIPGHPGVVEVAEVAEVQGEPTPACITPEAAGPTGP
jgi:hypothetical protein